MNKKIIFVTYGGGHARMILPVVKELQKNPAVTWSIVALTTAIPFFKSKNIPFYTFSDFITDADNDALSLGEELAEAMRNDSAGVPKEETVAYMGISYHELIADHGEEKAATLLKEGRQHFYPHRMMKRIIKHFNPDCIVTTNSPRAEKAAVHIGKELGVYTLTIVNLFGLHENYILCADTICVPSEYTKENLTKHGFADSNSNIVVTGNPAFDGLVKYKDQTDRLRKKRGIAKETKVILWASQAEPGLHPLTGKAGDPTLPRKIDMALLKAVANHPDWQLVIRPHPSENLNYNRLPDNVRISRSNDNLHELLSTVDVVITMSSTVGLEAVILKKPLITVDLSILNADIPYSKMNISRGISNLNDLEYVLEQELKNNSNEREYVYTTQYWKCY